MIHWLRRSIALKLTLTLVGFVAGTLVVAGAYLNRALERFAVESLESRLLTAGRLLHDPARALLARGAPAEAARQFVVGAAEATGSRATLITPDGRVVADSSVAPANLGALENHAGRPEVRAALAGRPGRDLRTSVSIQEPLLYVALPVRDGGAVIGVLRLALPLSAVTASYARIHRVMLAGGAVALAVALGIGLFVARRVTRPVLEMHAVARRMSEGDFAMRAPIRSPDEIGRLGRALNAMARALEARLADVRDERAKVAAILDGMAEGVIAVDGHDHVLLVNERARAMFALTPGATEDRPFLEVIRNVDLHGILRQCRATPASAAVRRELSLGGPTPRVFLVNAVPLRLGGDETGIVMVASDVSELRRLEQVRTEFVANVSHELRTPLTAIHGYLETLLGGALEETEHARRFLEIVFRHTERLGRLLDDLTDLSNIELGRVSLRLEPVDLIEVVESVLAIMHLRAEARQVALAADCAPDVPLAIADHDRVSQILVNLVDNAVKYTGAGGHVTVAVQSAAPDTLTVRVTDTGIGIPSTDLPRITERFYRVDKARSRELGGTGLGLAIVKHLVVAHGGELGIESAVGKGTSVRFTLPAASLG